MSKAAFQVDVETVNKEISESLRELMESKEIAALPDFAKTAVELAFMKGGECGVSVCMKEMRRFLK